MLSTLDSTNYMVRFSFVYTLFFLGQNSKDDGLLSLDMSAGEETQSLTTLLSFNMIILYNELKARLVPNHHIRCGSLL